MMKSKGIKTVALCSGILLFVLCVRELGIGSYRISTASMENTLYKDDYVLVNKLPAKYPKRNQILLFISPLIKDKNNAPLLVSRCVGLPGDTIQVTNDGYQINGTLYSRSPNSLSSYRLGHGIKNLFGEVLQKLNIPLRDVKESRTGFTLSLTPFEEYCIREELSEQMNKQFIREKTENYQFIVPRKGETYRLNETSITACKEAIRRETREKAEFRNNKLFLDGKETSRFRFKQDYYWLLSDNINEAVDSRHVGFIPASHIIGNVWFCWYSKDKKRRFEIIN
jgi:signal peptidase I